MISGGQMRNYKKQHKPVEVPKAIAGHAFGTEIAL